MKPRNKIQPLPFVLPALFVYILTVIIPILWSMGYSLFSWNGIGDMKFIGLENYVRMFQDETFREAVVKNLKFVVLYPSIRVMVISAVWEFASKAIGSIPSFSIT